MNRNQLTSSLYVLAFFSTVFGVVDRLFFSTAAVATPALSVKGSMRAIQWHAFQGGLPVISFFYFNLTS